MSAARSGFTFRNPKGELDWRVVATVEAAQCNAAFDLDLYGTGREFPKDWNTAYRRGYRVVRAMIVDYGSSGAWADYKG